MDASILIAAYLAGPGDLRTAVAGLNTEQLTARPIPGRWSVLEVVCHLADTDGNIAHRIKRVLAEETPAFDRVNPEGMLMALAYHGRDISEELAFIDVTRGQVARIFRATSPEVWERTGIVNTRGPRTVAQMITGAIDHLQHHLPFIMEKRRAMGLGD